MVACSPCQKENRLILSAKSLSVLCYDPLCLSSSHLWSSTSFPISFTTLCALWVQLRGTRECVKLLVASRQSSLRAGQVFHQSLHIWTGLNDIGIATSGIEPLLRQHLSHWVVEAIVLAYKSYGLSRRPANTFCQGYDYFMGPL